jgi:hypothetical protein
MPIVKHQERLMNELADAYEDFAGIWMDPEDQEHIYISLIQTSDQTTDREVVESSLTSIVRDRLTRTELSDASTPDYRFTIKDAEFTFGELKYYRDILNPIIYKMKGAAYSYINDSENHFEVGIREHANKERFQQLLNIYSLPENAFSIKVHKNKLTLNQNSEVESQITSALGHHTIRDHYRPLTGGFQIKRQNYNGNCTLGFNVKMNNTNMWVTSSLCTESPFNNGITEFFQNQIITGDEAGIEYRDPFKPSFTRNSAAALIETDFAQSIVNFGKLARTDNFSTSWGVNGSIVLNTDINYSDPQYFEIISDDDPITSGMQLHKVGRETGWTRGVISSPCYNVISPDFAPNWTFWCQVSSSTFAETGDRGSPAFIQNSFGPTANLVGIYIGFDVYWSIFSPLEGIRQDLVNFNETITTH